MIACDHVSSVLKGSLYGEILYSLYHNDSKYDKVIPKFL